MSHLTIDLSADDDTLEKAILFLASLRTPKPGAKSEQFTQEELTQQKQLMESHGAPQQSAPTNPFATNPVTSPGPQAAQNNFPTTSPAELAAQVQQEAPKAETPAVPTVSTEVDAAGYPWDERIHSSSRAKTTKGVWKLKRGVDKAVVKQVQAELMGGNTPPAQEAAPVMAQPQFPPMQNNPFAQQPAQQVQQQPNGNGAALTWPVLLQRITAANQGGIFNQAASDQFLSANGVTGGVAMLSQRPDLFEAYAQTVGV